ncbi:twin-arginine translocation signal domain-containing protein [Sinomonas atrocyanea]
MIRVSRRHFLQGAGIAVVGAVAGAGVARSSIFPSLRARRPPRPRPARLPRRPPVLQTGPSSPPS